MKQKDAVKLSVAIACILAAALIAYLTMFRGAAETPSVVVAPTGDAPAGTPTPGAAPKQEDLGLPGAKDPKARPSSPIRVAPGGG